MAHIKPKLVLLLRASTLDGTTACEQAEHTAEDNGQN